VGLSEGDAAVNSRFILELGQVQRAGYVIPRSAPFADRTRITTRVDAFSVGDNHVIKKLNLKSLQRQFLGVPHEMFQH
jgi:hypothetical protein